MPKLTKLEQKMSEEDLFLAWLVEGRVHFEDLTKNYVQYLEYTKRQYQTEASRYSNLLAQYLQFANMTPKTEWVKDKTIGTLYSYKRFATAPIQRSWEEIIKNNNINTNLNTLDWKVYNDKEDKNGT